MNIARLKRLQTALEILREVKDEEETALGNLPESIQSSEKGDAMQENVDSLDNAISEIEQVEGLS